MYLEAKHGKTEGNGAEGERPAATDAVCRQPQCQDQDKVSQRQGGFDEFRGRAARSLRTETIKSLSLPPSCLLFLAS